LGLHVDGAEAGLLKVRVYDAAGTCVRHIYEGPISKGPHKLSWDGSLDNGRPAAHGRYVIEVQSKAGVSRQELKL
jgi:flagellar hook assembly protein FlgD